MKKVIVTNQGEEPWAASWNGNRYVFALNEPITIPVAAATFLFNFARPEEMIDKVLVQNGWLKSSNDKDPFGPVAARKRLEGFIFRKAPEEVVKRPQPIVLKPLTRDTAQPAERAGEAIAASPAAVASVTDRVLSKIPGFGKKGDAAQANPGAT